MAHTEDQIQFRNNGTASPLEKLLFGRRLFFLALFTVITIVLGYFMLQLRPEASFLRMIPNYHPYIQNYIEHKDKLKSLGNVVRISVETTEGNIFSEAYLDTLKKMTEDTFFIKGVARAELKSLFTANTTWREVTMEGYIVEQVIPARYNGSKNDLDLVRRNVMKSGEIGSLVANNLKSSMIIVPLVEIDMDTGKPLDYQQLALDLEKIRDKYQKGPIKIHIVGFAKLMGDLIQGASRVILFFGIAFLLLLVILYNNCRCVKSTSIRALSSLVAVIWQMGILSLLGYGLNPYSMLVPFLMFALGVSHGIQMFNAMAHEMIYGADKLLAARLAFRQIFRPGLAALVTDCIGFSTLMVIRIGVIQDIAVGASVGVAVVAFTDLMLLPILMSYSGISGKTIDLVKKREATTSRLWSFLSKFTQKKYAIVAILLAVIGLIGGVYMRQGLKVGDLDPGAPELRADSRYNKDNAFINENYGTSSDVFVVMLAGEGPVNSEYTATVATDLLKLKMLQTKGVQGVTTYVDMIKYISAGSSEGNLKWMSIPKDETVLSNTTSYVPHNLSCFGGSLSPIMIYLEDHKAETLERIVKVTEAFAAEYNTEKYKFLLAAGNAGIEAATNIEVERAQLIMTVLVYAVVLLILLITYRDWRGALCVVLPLFLTSVLCEALMAKMGIGIKVATLPVIAVGVGIGVDYGIYIYNKLLYYRSKGDNLTVAFYRTLNTTGRAVSFTGITLSIGVATWAFSPIKFQADMGFLLTFMFLWNMVGAMVLLPALARFLLKDKPIIHADGVQ